MMYTWITQVCGVENGGGREENRACEEEDGISLLIWGKGLFV